MTPHPPARRATVAGDGEVTVTHASWARPPAAEAEIVPFPNDPREA